LLAIPRRENAEAEIVRAHAAIEAGRRATAQAAEEIRSGSNQNPMQ
jgi:hypothetical protein